MPEELYNKALSQTEGVKLHRFMIMVNYNS